MNDPQHKPNKVNQKVSSSKNVTQVGGSSSNTVNFTIWLTLIGILALGGLAWGLVFGSNQDGLNPQSGQERSVPENNP